MTLTNQRFNLAHAKSELGVVATSQGATDEELQPKPFQPQPFAVNPLAGRYRSQF
jgi:hypothetical protein